MASADVGDIHVDIEIDDAHGQQWGCHHGGADTEEGFAPDMVYEKSGGDGADDLDNPDPRGGEASCLVAVEANRFQNSWCIE